jgi:hypothetical protein
MRKSSHLIKQNLFALDNCVSGIKIYTMDIIKLMLCIACAAEIFVQLFRIIWLYFPSFMQRSFLYKRKGLKKTEMLIYYVLAIVAMAYYIFITTEKIF